MKSYGKIQETTERHRFLPMKKYLLILLPLMLLFILVGCAQEQTPPTTTVMVYMIGSDLESKSSAGTKDLEEMVSSGVDLSHTNVLVYAGGAPNWHNDLVQTENHSLLLLTESGFTPIATTAAYSMGESTCLTSFLQYGHDNFPADHFALVLWDHGNGPVIGYGKDMLFDNDCLTLKEMSQALADSPFGPDNKLEWVGFDACLMASAELTGVWAPYANYLVASQEVEPAFGWNYGFLYSVATWDTPWLLEHITDQYRRTCADYFTERGYQDRDITLSCMDLSKADALESAIDALFAKAAPDVPAEFNQLTARRVNTRALARATTGSEYDLVDLQDMAMWLGEMYPAEASALIEAIDNIVITNMTNAQGLCGLSLYYPFYNKAHYEMSWADAYAQLGVYPGYQTYLENYETIWLGNDKLDSASSSEPQKQNGAYTLQLTAEQAENLASAKYYILIRDGEEYFTRIFSSSDVDNQNGLLTAGFDGNILYVKDDFDGYHIPVSIEQDRVGDTGRYTVPVALTNYFLDLPQPEDFVKETQGYRYILNIHKQTGEVTVSGLVPTEELEDALANGKQEDADLSKWTNVYFFHEPHRFLSRYENGAVLPVSQWPEDRSITGNCYAIDNGVHFTYAPLVSGEYYLLFEMEDTQGNRYCSELLPIQTDGNLPTAEAAPASAELSWTAGEEILLTQEKGVKVWLQKVVEYGTERYNLRAENTNPYPIVVVGQNVYTDQQLLCRDSFGLLKVAANSSATYDYPMNLGTVSSMALSRDISQLTFDLYIRHGITYAVETWLSVKIKLSESTKLAPDETTITFKSFDQPAYGFLASSQMLREDSQLRIQLLGLGNNGIDDEIRGALYVENLSDTPVIIDTEGIRLDDLYFPLYAGKTTIPGHAKTYFLFDTSGTDIAPAGLTGATGIQLLLRYYEYNPLFSGNSLSTMTWYPITLSQVSEPTPLPQGRLLYNQDGLQIALLGSQLSFGYNSKWQLAVTNTTDQDIALRLLEPTVAGILLDRFVHITDNCIPAGATAICVISHQDYESKIPAPDLHFRLQIMDFKEEAILYELSQVISLPKAQEPKD